MFNCTHFKAYIPWVDYQWHIDLSRHTVFMTSNHPTTFIVVAWYLKFIFCESLVLWRIYVSEYMYSTTYSVSRHYWTTFDFSYTYFVSWKYIIYIIFGIQPNLYEKLFAKLLLLSRGLRVIHQQNKHAANREAYESPGDDMKLVSI